VLTYLCLSNRLPFTASSQEEVCEKIVRGDFSLDEEDDYSDNGMYRDYYYSNPAEYLEDGGLAEGEPFLWSNVSNDAKEFIRYLLTWDEDKRPTARQALKHPWIVTNTQQPSQRGQRKFSYGTGDEFVNSPATMAAWNNVAKVRHTVMHFPLFVRICFLTFFCTLPNSSMRLAS
jgi:serine/threonine protein kinase